MRGAEGTGAASEGKKHVDPNNMPVWLMRPDMQGMARAELAPGYSMRTMQVSEGALWEDVWFDAEPFVKIERGLFLKVFGEDLAAVPERCFFLIGPDGSVQGTISAWYSNDYRGGRWGRIHWVAVKKASQGKGLAKAMLAYAMQQMARWHDRAYLDTSTGRVGAIKVYLDYGFVPDMEAKEARVAWEGLAPRLEHPAIRAALARSTD